MRQTLFAQASRYGQVGIAVYLCDLASFSLALLAWPDGHLAANGIGRLSGAVLGFTLHRRYTFGLTSKGQTGWQAVRYLLVFFANLAASSALLWLIVDVARAPALPARVAVDVAVIAAAFVASRTWVFRRA